MIRPAGERADDAEDEDAATQGTCVHACLCWCMYALESFARAEDGALKEHTVIHVCIQTCIYTYTHTYLTHSPTLTLPTYFFIGLKDNQSFGMHVYLELIAPITKKRRCLKEHLRIIIQNCL